MTWTRSALSHRRAFSLLELSMVIGILSLLAAGIFSLTSATLDMTNHMAEFEQAEVSRSEYIELCRTNLSNLPGNAQLRLEPGILSIKNAPQVFGFRGSDPNIAQVVVRTLPDGAGFFFIQIQYLSPEESVRFDANRLDRTERPVLPLLRDVAGLNWRFFDSNQRIWVDEWFRQDRPSMIELTLALVGESTPTRAVFWVPGRQLPPQFGGARDIVPGEVDPNNPQPTDPNAPQPGDPNSPRPGQPETPLPNR